MHGNVQPIIDALKPMIKSYGVRKIGYAADVAAAKEGYLQSVPSLFVILMADKPKGASRSSDSCGDVLMFERFGVVIAVGNTDSHRADKNNHSLNDLRKEIRRLLWKLKPEGNWKTMAFEGGKLMFYNDTTLWFQDEYSTEYFDSVAP